MPAAEEPLAVHAIEREVAEIKQSERRTLDSLEAGQGTVEHVVDRLAMIESGIRETAPLTAPEPPAAPAAAAEPKLKLPAFAVEPAPEPAAEAPPIVPTEPAAHRTATRKPIDPSLPPDHPLEPGSGRSRPTASAADRIAASEAAVSSTKPPVLDDPGPKPNFIAAARRAAQAASAAASAETGKGAAALKNPRQRTRPLIIAGAAALIVIGCIQIASRLFEAGPQVSPAAPTQDVQPEKSAQPEKAPPPVTVLPEPAPPPAPPPAAPQPPAAAAPAPLPVPSAPPAALPVPQPNPKSGAN